MCELFLPLAAHFLIFPAKVSVFVQVQLSSCFSYALPGFHNSRHHTDASTLLHVKLGVAQQTKIRPSPEEKMLCWDFYEKMMGSKNGFESKYPSHSSAQRFNRITLMFYLTGFFDKYVVAGGDDLL